MGFSSASDAEQPNGHSSTPLRPTTSVSTTRYEKASRVNPNHVNISPGFYSYAPEREPHYLPPGWSAHRHPEGQLYFVCESNIRIVTEAYMYSSDVQEKVISSLNEFNGRLLALGTSLSGSTELFLELDDNAGVSLYYLVNYDTQVEFWIEEVDTEALCIPAAVSESHRRLNLEEHFWTHVEHFPSHRCKELALNREELSNIFLHARADQMTSAYSTFPYNARQCTEFLDLLNSAPCASVNPYSTSLVARLWAVVYNHRFSIHYGEQHSRLSRDQSILDIPKMERGFLYRVASRVLFGIPDAYVQTLDGLFVDNLVYVDQWREAMVSCRQEWMLCSFWGLALIIVDILSFLIPSSSRVFALASVLLSNLVVISAVILLVRHHRAIQFHASDAADYLADVRRESSGFQRTAMAFSLPKALFLWALGTFSMQGLVWLLDATNVYVVGAVIALMSVLVLCSFVDPSQWSSTEDKSESAVSRFFERLRMRGSGSSAADSAV